MYQREIDMDMLNAVRSLLADVSSVSPLPPRSDEGLTLDETSANTLYGIQHMHINLTLIHSLFYRYAEADYCKTSSHRD